MIEIIATGTMPFQSYFWPLLWASLGGLVILIGLLLEVLAEKKEFKSINSFRICALLKRFGEWLVISGIAVELIVGCFAVRDAKTTEEIIKRNSPLNQPVSDITATAKFELRESRIEDVKQEGLSRRDAWLGLEYGTNMAGRLNEYSVLDLYSERLRFGIGVSPQISHGSLKRRAGDDFGSEFDAGPPFFEKAPGRSLGAALAFSFFAFFRRF